MAERNPYYISFGRIPTQYISRALIIDSIMETLLSDRIEEQAQIMIREEMPIFVIVAGLYEDIESLENTDGLTFFLRATKYEMTPLNYTSIREDYERTLGVSREIAEQLAILTKGYPFAYQALGKYMWDERIFDGDKLVRSI